MSWYKFNFDGSFISKGRAFSSCLIRDSAGTIMGAWTREEVLVLLMQLKLRLLFLAFIAGEELGKQLTTFESDMLFSSY